MLFGYLVRCLIIMTATMKTKIVEISNSDMLKMLPFVNIGVQGRLLAANIPVTGSSLRVDRGTLHWIEDFEKDCWVFIWMEE